MEMEVTTMMVFLLTKTTCGLKFRAQSRQDRRTPYSPEIIFSGDLVE
jgi:hypothetical protein